MIKKLKLEHIGPASKLQIEEFGSRLNVITGDNGLGKSLWLDACWYALTRTFPNGKQFYPAPSTFKSDMPRMDYTIFDDQGKDVPGQANYNFSSQTWRIPQSQPSTPGLVVYARVDGGFSVWDPFRNDWPDEFQQVGEIHEGPYQSSSSWAPQRPPAFQFSNKQVWDGFEDESEGQKFTFCNGFLRDVETWRLKGNGPFRLLQGVLEALSSNQTETLSIDGSVRVSVNDLRDIPRLRLPYESVPVTQASAGMRRVLALAYLLVWVSDEHVRAAKLVRKDPASRIVLLFDEVESHLHPKWQRVFLPALPKVVEGLLVTGQSQAAADDPDRSLDQKADFMTRTIPKSVQIVATTHSPIILASVESTWKAETDRLFDFKLSETNQVLLEQVDFARHGSISN
jgi:hypothetical protein